MPTCRSSGDLSSLARPRRQSEGQSGGEATTPSRYNSGWPNRSLRAPVKLSQHELVVTQSFGGGEAAPDRVFEAAQGGIGGLVEVHLHPQNAGEVHVDMFRHGLQKTM